MKRMPINFILIILFLLSILGCSDDNKCDDFTIIDGTITIDDEDFRLFEASLLTRTDGVDSYTFKIHGIDEFCENWWQFAFTVATDLGTDVSGIYPIIAFGNFADLEASGLVTIKESNEISIIQLFGGTIEIRDQGGNSFDLEMDAALAGDQDTIRMSINHQF